ncbi:hypothetical protein H1D32_02570 [Anaerobacillus sp. CMMVII]|uniref:hypothetical protein n=1 Tax=Anaerobacillus sp. CMMVII TaxID=2755588 RepID=UPI0021B73C80|nr:hypothetical protein [Anaerobacillus sp. CMMVII]MCT8136732.1 hypothetical protein [Anaerobacillus sp. CMMVII]
MSKQIVYCDKCSREITDREDLVTAVFLFSVVPYHDNCYSKDLKGAKTLFLDNQPLNGFSGNFIFIISIIMAILWFLFADAKIYSFLAILPIGYRLYSYFMYERHTEKYY